MKLGARARPALVRIELGQAAVSLVAEGARVDLLLRDASSIEAESVDAGRGLAIGIVRVTSASGAKAGAVLVRARNGKLRFAFSGALDPRGDPGERSWSTIEVVPRAPSSPAGAQSAQGASQPAPTASAENDVVVALRHERIAVCGESPAAVNARVVDPETAELRPYAVARWAQARGSVETPLTAAPFDQAVARSPQLRALQMKGVSSLAGAEVPWLGSPVSALADDNASTAWITRAESGGRGELATFTVDSSGLAVRALAITPRATGTQVVARAPHSLWLVSDTGPALHVSLPEPVVAGQRYWIALAKPTPMRCLSVVVDEVSRAGTAAGTAVGSVSASAAQGSAIAELELYTDLDFGGGLERLVQELSSDGAAASRAADLLQRVGPVVIAPLVAAALKMPPSARARAVRVWAAYGSNSAARTALQGALDDPDARVRELAIEGLARSGPEGQRVLAARIASGGATGDDAAAALAASAPLEAIAAITGAWQAGASERPRLRAALVTACDRAGASCVARVRAWTSAGALPVSAAAEAALALAALESHEEIKPLTTELISSSVKQAERFEDQWRLVQAAQAAAPSPEIDAWLAKLAIEDERWMLRAASLQTLSQRAQGNTGQFAALARKALEDKYPRVRLAAAKALEHDPEATDGLIVHAQRDRWPMVRAAAYETLAQHIAMHPKSATEALIGGVSDRAKNVRAAALSALATAQVQSAWPVVEERLRHDNEWPEVSVAALQYVRALCLQQAKDAVAALLQRGLAPKAADFEFELTGPAFETLVHLGGDAARDALKIALRSSSPPGLKAMAQRAERELRAKRATTGKSECVRASAPPAPVAPSVSAPVLNATSGAPPQAATSSAATPTSAPPP